MVTDNENTTDKPAIKRTAQGKFVKGQTGNPAGRPKLKRQVKKSQRDYRSSIPLACQRIVDAILRRPQTEFDEMGVKDLLPTLTALSRQVDALSGDQDIQITIVRTEGVEVFDPENVEKMGWRAERDAVRKGLVKRLDAARATIKEQTEVIERDNKRYQAATQSHQAALEALETKQTESIKRIFRDKRLFDYVCRGIDEAERERITEAAKELEMIEDDSYWT